MVIPQIGHINESKSSPFQEGRGPLSSRLSFKVLTLNSKFKNISLLYIHYQVDHLTSVAYLSNHEKAI